MPRVRATCAGPVSLLLAIAGGSAVAGKAAAVPAVSPKADHAMPSDLKPNQVWVSSVPVGLEVYYGVSWKEKELKGKTPITIDRRPGANMVFVYTDAYPKSEVSTSWGPRGQEVTLKSPPHTGVNTMMENLYTTSGGQETRLNIVYTLDPKDDSPRTIVALFQPSNKTFAELAAIYPSGRNFTFDDAEGAEVLAAKEVPEKDASAILGLLHRGGRIAIKRVEKRMLYVEIGAGGRITTTEP